MKLTELAVTAQEEQNIVLSNGYTAALRFDMVYKRWFYDLYLNDVLVYAGVALTPDTAPLHGISPVSLGIVDFSEDKSEYEPYSELGARLALMEITQ